jgi:trk system potassium uptake protein TrkH
VFCDFVIPPATKWRVADLKKQIHPSRLVVLAFLGVVAVGTALLMMPFTTKSGEATSFADALFTSASAVTVTGLATVDTQLHWNIYGHWVIALLIQIGGFGIVGFATLLGYLVDGRISLSSRMTAKSEAAVSGSADVKKLITSILKMMLFFEALLFAFLFYRFFTEYDYDFQDAVGHGAFHSISAFNNAGFALYSDSLMSFARDGWIIIPIFVGAFMGSLGFPVLSEGWDRLKNNTKKFLGRKFDFMPVQWSLNSRIILWASLILVVGGTVYIAILEWNNPKTLGPLDPITKIFDSIFASIMPRTAGFNAQDITAMHPSTWLGMDVLMFIGGGSASTAGGIKIGTAVVLAYIVFTEIRGETAVNIGNRRLPRSIQRQALTIVGLTASVSAFAIVIMRLTTDFPLDNIIFDVLSAVCTVGLSTGVTMDMHDPGKVMFAILMFIGRVGPVSMATALALRRAKRHFEYPKESPLIG